MSNIGSFAGMIQESMLGVVFGNALLSGVILLVIFMAVLWYIGMPMDAVIVIMVPLIIAFAGYSMLPLDIAIVLWLGIGFIGFLIFMKLMRW